MLDRTDVDVSVLSNVFFADGDVNDLGVALVQGYSSSARVLPDKKIRVVIGEHSQIIPFSVSHPDDDTIRSYGFIWVPGTDDALPQINKKAPPLRVASESLLRIDIDQYVVALGGSRVRITDPGTVRATHANGDPLVVNDHTLAFTSADRYFGPASITFEVTDGGSANDPKGHTAILTLPITVDPRENQPPVFIGGVVDFEPGQSKELDLVRLTNYPYNDVAELTYSILQPLPVGFTAQLNGQRLELTAARRRSRGRPHRSASGSRMRSMPGKAAGSTFRSCRLRVRSPSRSRTARSSLAGRRRSSMCSPTTKRGIHSRTHPCAWSTSAASTAPICRTG